MYPWIWRHLPFGLPGRIAGSLLLVTSLALLLWFVVFPVAEPFMPFTDGQIDTSGTGSDPGGSNPNAPAGDPKDYEPQYRTDENNTDPNGGG